MTVSNFKNALRFTLKYEGGYVDHPADPGGATNLGITHRTLAAFRGRSVTKADVRALTHDEAAKIYKLRYWDKIEGDALPLGVDLAVFDYAVNSGPAKAAKALQKIVGVTADGVIGMDTLDAAKARDPSELINAICDERLAFVKRLKTWRAFGKGWSSRIAAVRKTALKMAKAGGAAVDESAGEPTGKARPTDKSLAKSTTAGAAAAAGAAGAATPAIEAIKQAQEAAEAGKGIWDVAISVGPWVLLALVIAGAAAYIIWERRRRSREEGV